MMEIKELKVNFIFKTMIKEYQDINHKNDYVR